MQSNPRLSWNTQKETSTSVSLRHATFPRIGVGGGAFFFCVGTAAPDGFHFWPPPLYAKRVSCTYYPVSGIELKAFRNGTEQSTSLSVHWTSCMVSLLHWFRTTNLNLWAVTPLGVDWPFSRAAQDHPAYQIFTLEFTPIAKLQLNRNKDNFIVGITTT